MQCIFFISVTAQVLLELSKQQDSRELIISNGCVPYIINRTNDVHCGQDSAMIFLELASSPRLAVPLLAPDTFAALQQSLRDVDAVKWRPTLCMALTNCLASGAESVRRLESSRHLVALGDSALRCLQPPHSFGDHSTADSFRLPEQHRDMDKEWRLLLLPEALPKGRLICCRSCIEVVYMTSVWQ